MRIYIDGLSPLAHAVTRKLLDNHGVSTKDILVNTYNRNDTNDYRDWLESRHVSWIVRNYKDADTVNMIKKFDPDIILNVYGLRILPCSILKSAQWTINLHPSYLPDYKGRWICPWAIINAETEHGITFHAMTEKIDGGDILFQKKVAIDVDETSWSLYHKLIAEFVNEFDVFFSRLINNQLTPKVMPEGGRYFSAGIPFDGKINHKWSLQQVDRFIRAMFFPPHTGAVLDIDGVRHECTSLEHYRQLIAESKFDMNDHARP
jgi:methionyl-tRNA formyltransferase